MTPTDFGTDLGLGILASWLANQLGSSNETKLEEPEEPNQANDASKRDVQTLQIQKFKSYDVFHDLEDMLKYINEPVAHIVVENSPSSFYNLAALVIEDKTTGIWFVFNRGRMAFQGTGGGALQTDRAVSIFKNQNISVAPWAISKEKLDSFESGFILWTEVKNILVPLISSIESTEKWDWIQKQAKEVLYAEEQG